MRQRDSLSVNAGNLLELVAAVVGTFGVYRLAGSGWALIAAFVLLVALAEWVFPVSVWTFPLPRKPRPRAKLQERKQALQLRWYRLKARWSGRRQP